jgi:preprotein translocase subunit YajC
MNEGLFALGAEVKVISTGDTGKVVDCKADHVKVELDGGTLIEVAFEDVQLA